MKKLFLLFAAALMSASMFAQPATVPTVTDLADAGYDLTGRVICLYFDEQVCNDIVWAGSYNEWSTTPVDMMPFEPLDGYDGWYVIELWDDSDPCQGRPVQLKNDGSFSWDFQSGDPEAWINMAQPFTKTATIGAGSNPDESNCTWPTTGAYIYEVAYFKNHNTPCGAPVEYKYTEYENWQIKYGNRWEWSDNMEKVEDGLFKLEVLWEGTGFNVKSDANPIKKDWFAPEELVLGEEVIAPVTVDVYLQVIDDETVKIGVGVIPDTGADPVEGDQFVDATSGLKFEVTAVGEANTVKVLANDYEGTSYTIPATVSYQSVTFNVTEIGAEAFMNCSSLESITIPEGVTTIGGETFHECSSLVSVNMPASVTTIGESAFYGCALQSITIPAGVTTIGSGAFANNNGLTSVTFLGNACQNNIGEDAFYNVGSTETPATLVLPDTWTGSTPDQDGNWYGGHFDYDAPAPEYKYTEYENWQIKYGNTWEWSDNMEKVEDGLFKLEVLWEGTGFNVKSDENPIKKDWFAVEELVIGEEVIAPVIVDVYLKVIDDEHIRIGIGTNPGVGPTDAINIINTEDVPNGAIIKDGKVYIIRNGKLYNLQGSEIKNADEILKSIQF